MKANKLKARGLAKKLLKTCNIYQAPINLGTVIHQLKLNVLKINLPEIQGFDAQIDYEANLITLNTSHAYVRKRFTLAHEIGHHVLGHKDIQPEFDLESKDPREVEANYFAAELLIPFDWIKKDSRIIGATTKELAEKYKVSEDAMGWRLYKSDALLVG